MNPPKIQRRPYQSVPVETGLRWNYSEEKQFTEMVDDLHVVGAFVSPSATPIKIVFRVPLPTDANAAS